MMQPDPKGETLPSRHSAGTNIFFLLCVIDKWYNKNKKRLTVRCSGAPAAECYPENGEGHCAQRERDTAFQAEGL